MDEISKNNLTLSQEHNWSINGEYSIEVIKADGSIEKPFGDIKYKNLILDSFFNSILNGYKFGIQSFIQTCIVGNSNVLPARVQTTIQGTQLGQTSASTYFNTLVDQSTNTISMTRDFVFSSVIAETIYREAVVGCFGMQHVSDITTSRFVFPAEIVIGPGDRLKIVYTLNIRLNYIFNDFPISISHQTLDFSGKVRMSANTTGIFSIFSGTNTFIPLGDTTEFVYRDYTQNSVNVTKTSVGHSGVGIYQNIFGLPSWVNKVGFFNTTHVPLNFPSGKASYTPVGPTGQVSRSNVLLAENSGTVNVEYFFPQFVGQRDVGGIYLWYYDNPNSHTAIYYKFNNNQTIPALTPVTLRLKWAFFR
jgi:hypothetical protein